MESIGTSQRGDINILSNVLLCDDIFRTGITNYSNMPNKANIDCRVNLEESSPLFKNLEFEFPNPKRKNSFSNRESVKKLRPEPSSDDCDADDDKEVKIFNYLTGTYESVKQTVKEEVLEDTLEIKEENMSIDENSLIKEEFVAINVTDDTIVKDNPIEPLQFEVFDSTILNTSVNSRGQLNEHILTETSPQVLNSLPVSRECDANRNNLDKFVLPLYLASHVLVFNGQQQIAPPLNSKSLKTPLVPQSKDYESTLGQLWEYKCKSCSYIAKTKAELMLHTQSVHYKLSHSRGVTLGHCGRIKLVKTLLWRDSTKCDVVFKCLDCDTTFDERSQLEMHVCSIPSVPDKFVLNQLPENGERTVIQKDSHEVLASAKGGQTSILYGLLTANKDSSANGRVQMGEAIEILSDDDDEMSDASSVSVEESNNESLLSDELGADKQLECTLPSEPESDVKVADGSIMNDTEMEENNGSQGTNENNDVNQEHNSTGVKAYDLCISVDQVETPTTENPKLKFQCFDCHYSNVGDLPQFRRHAAKHIGSKFRCMPHSDASDDDCAKCRYERTLSDIEKRFKRCLKCGFVAEEASILKAHLCDVRCSPGDVRCFHCPYVTSRNKYLHYHAVDHVEEGFACGEHASANLDACPKCVYEYCLEMAKKDALVCEICGFKSVIIAVFDVHPCSALYTCWDCKLDSFNTIDTLRMHAVAHYKSDFHCEDHKSAVNDCSQCLYQAVADSLDGNVFVCQKCSLRTLSKEILDRHSAGGCTVPVTPSNNGKFKCFHCNYATDNKNLLKYHCKEHYNATFTCEDHPPELQHADCPKCVYQKLLNWSQKSVFVCNKCSFKTFNAFRFKSHKSKSHSATFDSTLPFQCFDCGAKFKFIQGLKYHAVGHSDSNFRCADHKSKPAPTCQKCIYENTIKTLQEGTLTCKKCGFRSHVWSIMKIHESDEANCEVYKAKLVAQGKSVAIKPVETYSCFDCDFSHERLDFLKAHVKEHRASEFQCDEHKTANADCPKCRYVQIVSAAPPTARKRRVHCYDCGRRKSFVELMMLHKHVAKEHPQSHFACTYHVEKKDNSCTRCLYGKVVREVVGHKYFKLICWGCDGNKLFSCRDTYEDHIVESHLYSEFMCPDHGGKNHKRCSKCLYQKILQQPTKTLKFQCCQCEYSHKQFYTFRRHARTCHPHVRFKCDKHPSDCPTSEYCPQCFYYRIKTETPASPPFYRCYECQRTFNRLLLLKGHIKEEHKKSSFVCTLHPDEGGTNCASCFFEIMARHLTGNGEYRYECTSCNYKCDKPISFRLHKHREFECREHSVKDCRQCFWGANEICYACVNPTPLPNVNALKEHIEENHKTSPFVCPSHIIITVDCNKCIFQRQLERIQEQQCMSSRCFDCDYTTAKLSALRYHAWQQHRDSQYQCKQHLLETSDCQQCSYATVIESIRKFTCYRCKTLPIFSGVESLREHVFDVHDEKDFYVCPDEHSSSGSGCNKCFFQKLVRDVFILRCHDCDVAKSFQGKDTLKQHIKEHHITSKFICNVHPLGPNCATCSQCCYEELLRACSNSSKEGFPHFKCFDCNYYETDKDSSIKCHIRKEHFDSEFTCRTHYLGEIDRTCSECTYEHLVLQVKEQS